MDNEQRKWTRLELNNIALTAVDNALDEAGDGPLTQTFESELEFQLNAPEHRGRPKPTPEQVAFIREVWDSQITADERTSLLNSQATAILQPQKETL